MFLKHFLVFRRYRLALFLLVVQIFSQVHADAAHKGHPAASGSHLREEHRRELGKKFGQPTKTAPADIVDTQENSVKT